MFVISSNLFQKTRNKKELNPENGGINPDTSQGRRLEGCIWINTNVRGVEILYENMVMQFCLFEE